MRNFCLCCLAVWFVLLKLGDKFGRVTAATTQIINTHVQVSVCGNYVVEGGEDCEGLDLNGASCYSLGFGGGDLACDIACGFDTYNCLPPTPTPTPTPTPAPSPTLLSPTTSPTPAPPTPTQVLLGNPVITKLLEQVTTTVVLPEPLQKYDLQGEGQLRLENLQAIVTLWVNDWRQYLAVEVAARATVDQATVGEDLVPIGLVSPTQVPGAACDLNQDNYCNLVDFSILLHYIDG